MSLNSEKQTQPELEDRFFYYHKNNTLFGVRQGKWKYLAPSLSATLKNPGEDAKSGRNMGGGT